MATADKLNRLLETKKAIKDAIIEKGVEVGDVFATYPEKIKEIETGGSGGVATTYTVNEGNKVFEKDEKVLVKYEAESFNTKSNVVTEPVTNAPTYCEPVWFDDDTFCIFGAKAGTSFKYKKENNEWKKISVQPITATAITCFKHLPGMGMGYDNSSNSQYEELNKIIDEDGYRNSTYGSYSGYMGKFNDKAWAWKNINNNTGGVYINDTLAALEGAYGVYTLCVDYATRRFMTRCVYSNYYNIIIYQINDTGTGAASILSSAAVLPNNYRCLGCTGLETGDYVIFRSQNSSNCAMLDNSAETLGKQNNKYEVYRIGEKAPLVALANDDVLKRFLDMNYTIWHMDTRHNCLIIGTTTNVYVLEFDKERKIWSVIADNIPLPDNADGYIYNATLSPNKRILTVYAGDCSTGVQNLRVYEYEANTNLWKVVKNDSLSYKPSTTFTGFATGEEKDGLVGVKTLLPNVVDLTIVTNVDVNDDEIEIVGDIE